MKNATVHKSQNVTDYPNNNTIFAVWKFKEDVEVKPVFEKLCALVANLNHSFIIRVPGGRATCVMGVGYDAWTKLALRRPLPKELKNFEPICPFVLICSLLLWTYYIPRPTAWKKFMVLGIGMDKFAY